MTMSMSQGQAGLALMHFPRPTGGAAQVFIQSLTIVEKRALAITKTKQVYNSLSIFRDSPRTHLSVMVTNNMVFARINY